MTTASTTTMDKNDVKALDDVEFARHYAYRYDSPPRTEDPSANETYGLEMTWLTEQIASRPQMLSKIVRALDGAEMTVTEGGEINGVLKSEHDDMRQALHAISLVLMHLQVIARDADGMTELILRGVVQTLLEELSLVEHLLREEDEG